jgi:putative transposase
MLWESNRPFELRPAPSPTFHLSEVGKSTFPTVWYLGPSMPTYRALTFSLREPPSPALLALFADFRLLTNLAVRRALEQSITSRPSLSRYVRDNAIALRVNGSHSICSLQIALGLVAGWRRKARQSGHPPRFPYVRTPFLRADDSTFHFDPSTGRLRLSLRRTEWTSLQLQTSDFHRRYLADPTLRVKQVHLTPTRAVFILEKTLPAPIVPTSLLALDTNEGSPDGVTVGPTGVHPVRVDFREIPVIQHRSFARRRRIARRKAHDRRVGRRLLKWAGTRERNRVVSRLHALTRQLVETAARHRSAIALEDLSRMRKTGRPFPRGRSARTRRRLSSWPRGELHRQLTYKAAAAGVPVVWVDPYLTSRSCPRCGAVKDRRSRVGPVFDCERCGWRMDRQINAGVNIGRTALGLVPELGGLQLDPDALLKDRMSPLYPWKRVPRARDDRRAAREPPPEGLAPRVG